MVPLQLNGQLPDESEFKRCHHALLENSQYWTILKQACPIPFANTPMIAPSPYSCSLQGAKTGFSFQNHKQFLSHPRIPFSAQSINHILSRSRVIVQKGYRSLVYSANKRREGFFECAHGSSDHICFYLYCIFIALDFLKTPSSL